MKHINWATPTADEMSEIEDYSEACEAIKEKAGKMLVEAGIVAEGKGYGMAYRIWEYELDGISFSSPEAEEFLKNLNEWMKAEERKAR